MSGDLQARMQGILDAFVAQGIVGASAAVVAGGGVPVTAVAGLADRARGIPVDPAHLFKNGSCTKTFVAATLLRLARAGTVRLDDPAARWFPDLPKGDRIRVRDLINHRSGLPEFEFDMPMTPGLRWTPQAIVDLAFRARPQDEPHRVASYSNTGYVLAGMVIEAATGDSLAGQIRRQVLQPLGLSDSFCAAGEAYPEDRLARGYYHRPPPAAGAALSLEQGGEMWAHGRDPALFGRAAGFHRAVPVLRRLCRRRHGVDAAGHGAVPGRSVRRPLVRGRVAGADGG